MADLESVERRISRCEKLLKTNDKDNKNNYEILKFIKSKLSEGELINLKEFSNDEQKIVRNFQLLSSKPTFYIANINIVIFRFIRVKMNFLNFSPVRKLKF